MQKLPPENGISTQVVCILLSEKLRKLRSYYYSHLPHIPSLEKLNELN
jgi:hypothetical protein